MKYSYTFNTPEWLDTAYATTKYAWRSLKWLINPCRCSSCGVKVPNNSVKYEINDPFMLAVEHLGNNVLCPKCIIAGMQKPYKPRYKDRYNVKNKCDCCGKRKISYKIFENEVCKIHYCKNSWNSNHICNDCAITVITLGSIKTSHYGSDGFGMHRPMNNKGLYLRSDGSVMLFQKVKYCFGRW
jgi:hypothetical protein